MRLSATSRSTGENSPEVVSFYDSDTGSIQYLVIDSKTRKGALIDIVQGFDPASGSTDKSGPEEILRYIAACNAGKFFDYVHH